MMVHRQFFRRATLAVTGGLAAAVVFTAGCGSAMAPAAFGWNLTGVTAYGGNPSVTIVRTQGAVPTGSFTVPAASADARAGDNVFVEVTYYAEVPGVNPSSYTGSTPIGTFDATWTEVPATAGAAPRATFNSTQGTTFTGYVPSPTPNVRVNGDSGNFVTVSSPGPVTLRLHVTFQASDGSSRSKDFDVTLNVLPPSGA